MFAADLKQTALFTNATSTSYSIRYQGALLSDATKTVDYEVLFTFGSTSAQIFVISNNLGTSATLTDNVLIVNGVASNNWSTLSNSTMTATAGTSLPTNNNVDDNRTQITLTAPVSVPVNSTIPTLTGTLTVGSVLTFGVGTWTNSPTSYDLRLYRGTANVSSGETLAKNAGNVTSSTYTITQADLNSGQLYFRAFATATNSGGTSNGGVLTAGTERGPITAAASVPANTSQPTLSGGLTVGNTLTFGIGSWSGSPTSYALRLYRGTAGVLTSETLVKNAGNVTSSTYVTTQADYDSGQRYFRAFATATNAAGTSNGGTFTPGQEIGPLVSGSPATAPGTPGVPTNGWSGGLSYPFSWTAPTPGTVSGGGAATISSYSIRIYRASSGTGTGATLYSTYSSTSASYTFAAPDTQYYAAAVAATNSAGLTGNYSGISQYK